MSKQALFADLLAAEQAQIAALAAQAHVYAPQGEDKLLLLTDNEACSAFAAWRQVADEAELLGIAVKEALRGQGIGTALLAELAALWQAAGIAKVFLEVRAGNLAAQRLYEGGGFAVSGRRRGYYPPALAGGSSEDALLMVKEIKA